MYKKGHEDIRNAALMILFVCLAILATTLIIKTFYPSIEIKEVEKVITINNTVIINNTIPCYCPVCEEAVKCPDHETILMPCSKKDNSTLVLSLIRQLKWCEGREIKNINLTECS